MPSLAQIAGTTPRPSRRAARSPGSGSLSAIRAAADTLEGMGQRGDSELVHVNPLEVGILQKLSGNTTRNPATGLRQFFGSGGDKDDSGKSGGGSSSGSSGGGSSRSGGGKSDKGGSSKGSDGGRGKSSSGDRSGGGRGKDASGKSGGTGSSSDSSGRSSGGPSGGSSGPSDRSAGSRSDVGKSDSSVGPSVSRDDSDQNYSGYDKDGNFVARDMDLTGPTEFAGGAYDAGYGGGPGAAGGLPGGGLPDWGGGSMGGHNFSEDPTSSGLGLHDLSQDYAEMLADARDIGNSFVENMGNAFAKHGLHTTERAVTMDQVAADVAAGLEPGAHWGMSVPGVVGSIAGAFAGAPLVGTITEYAGDYFGVPDIDLGPDVFGGDWNGSRTRSGWNDHRDGADVPEDDGGDAGDDPDPADGTDDTLTDRNYFLPDYLRPQPHNSQEEDAAMANNTGTLARLVANQGQDGDTRLIHASPQAQGILRALGGSGDVNPATGKRGYAMKRQAFDTNLYRYLYGDQFEDDATDADLWQQYVTGGRNAGNVANLAEFEARDKGYTGAFAGTWRDALRHVQGQGYTPGKDTTFIDRAGMSTSDPQTAVDYYMSTLDNPSLSPFWTYSTSYKDGPQPPAGPAQPSDKDTVTSGTTAKAVPSYRRARYGTGTVATGF